MLHKIKILKTLIALLIAKKSISSIGLLYFAFLFGGIKIVSPFKKKYHWVYKNVNGSYKGKTERIR